MKKLLDVGLLLVMVSLFIGAAVSHAKIPDSDFFVPVLEIRNQTGDGILPELRSRLQDTGYIAGEVTVGAGHYATHKLNNELREKYRCSASYIPGGWAFVVPHPTGFTLTEVVDRAEFTLPGRAIAVASWDDQPFYLFDELAAYVCGTMAGLEAGMADTARVRLSYRNAQILLHHVRVMIDLAKTRGYPHTDELELLYNHYSFVVNMLHPRLNVRGPNG